MAEFPGDTRWGPLQGPRVLKSLMGGHGCGVLALRLGLGKRGTLVEHHATGVTLPPAQGPFPSCSGCLCPQPVLFPRC